MRILHECCCGCILLEWESHSPQTHPPSVSYCKHFFPPQASCLLHAFAFMFALSGNLDIFIWDYLACVRYSSLWSPGSCILFLTSSLALLSFYQMSSIVPPYFTLGCFNYAWMRSASQSHVSIFSLNNCAQNEKSLHHTWEALHCSWVTYGLILVLWSRQPLWGRVDLNCPQHSPPLLLSPKLLHPALFSSSSNTPAKTLFPHSYFCDDYGSFATPVFLPGESHG